jgi:hypothetical protein
MIGILIILLIFAAGFGSGFGIRARISARRHMLAKNTRHMFGGPSTP